MNIEKRGFFEVIDQIYLVKAACFGDSVKPVCRKQPYFIGQDPSRQSGAKQKIGAGPG